MSLSLLSTLSAVAAGITSSFQGSDGLEPYVYEVLTGGAGGTIDASTGVYTAPLSPSLNPKLSSDTIQVTDDNGDTARLSILVSHPLGLVCEIIQKEMGLANGRVYLWDQKIMQPTDSGIYVAVGVQSCKPFGNTLAFTPDGDFEAIQSINMLATLSLDIISRSNEALFRKEELLMALASVYSQQQQQANSFFVGVLPVGGQFVNLSNIDGEAIPYRFSISVNMQYFARKIKEVAYFDEFAPVSVVTES